MVVALLSYLTTTNEDRTDVYTHDHKDYTPLPEEQNSVVPFRLSDSPMDSTQTMEREKQKDVDASDENGIDYSRNVRGAPPYKLQKSWLSDVSKMCTDGFTWSSASE